MVRRIGHHPGSAPSAAVQQQRRDALLGLMQHCYEQIRTIEAEFGIQVDVPQTVHADLRPRIEYFHDAVRVLTDNPDAMYQPRSRLSVEWLAYDLGALRYIQDKPLARLDRSAVLGSASKSVATRQANPASAQRMPTPAARAELSTQYRSYTVFFSAVFAVAAERNYQSRVDDLNQQVADAAQVEQMIQMLATGQAPVTESQIEDMILHLDNEAMRQKLMVLLHQQSQKKREKLDAMCQILKQEMKGCDAQIAFLDKQHLSYVSGQMVLLQDSRDLVKKLSSQGLNLAGRFLEAAMQAIGAGVGRGV